MERTVLVLSAQALSAAVLDPAVAEGQTSRFHPDVSDRTHGQPLGDTSAWPGCAPRQ